MMHHNLYNAIDNNATLTDAQKAGLLSLVGKRCSQDTKDRLARALTVDLGDWENFGIFRRVDLSNGEVSYICGQSWSDEMRTIRKCILGG